MGSLPYTVAYSKFDHYISVNPSIYQFPGRVTIGSDPTCDIYVVGTGVASVHCRVENSHAVVTLYPLSGSTLLDGLPVDKPTRLSQGNFIFVLFNKYSDSLQVKTINKSYVNVQYINLNSNYSCRQHSKIMLC